MQHLTEQEIEKYAMGKTPENELAVAEEHFLVCESCRNELELIGLIICGLREESCRPSHS